MPFRSMAVLSLWLALTTPAGACELIGSRSHEQLVFNARAIVRARAEQLSEMAGPQGLFPVFTRVRFRVLAVYKGAITSETLQFNGTLHALPTPDRPISYDFKRARSATPSCFNTTYLAGAEYLLLLGPDDGIYSPAGELTPYWGAQDPTNERIVGDRDPWLVWVLRRLGRRIPN